MMAVYICKQTSSWGNVGDLVEIKGELTKRQAQLLAKFDKEPKKGEQKLEVATPTKAEAKDKK